MDVSKLGYALGGAIASQVVAWLIEILRRPRICLDTGDAPPFVGVAGGDHGLQKWFRVRARNVRFRQAENCRAYLSYLRKDSAPPLAENDALALWASSFGDAGKDKPITIPRGLARYFDVLTVSQKPDGSYCLLVCTDAGGTRFLDLDEGVYEVGVTVVGSGFSARTILYRFDFDGTDSPKVTHMRQH